MTDKLKKGYLFGMNHNLPSICLMDNTGYVVASHGGESIADARNWFFYFKKDAGYDIEEIDQKLVDEIFYKGASPDILDEKHPEFAELLKGNAAKNRAKKGDENGKIRE